MTRLLSLSKGQRVRIRELREVSERFPEVVGLEGLIEEVNCIN